MTYHDLADQLADLAGLLRAHATALGGAAAAKVAGTLSTQAAKLRQMLATAARRTGPEARRLQDLLAAHASWLSAARLGALAKELGFKLPGAKSAAPVELRAKFAAAALESGVAPAAADRIEAIALALARPKAELESEAACRAELRRLGARPMEEITAVLDEKFSDDEVRALARAAGLKVAARAARKSVQAKLIPVMRQHSENTA